MYYSWLMDMNLDKSRVEERGRLLMEIIGLDYWDPICIE